LKKAGSLQPARCRTFFAACGGTGFCRFGSSAEPRISNDFCFEQPGVLKVHDAGDSGRYQFEFEGDDPAQTALLQRLISAGFPVLEFSAS
jgi:hypothetical protein